MTLNELKAEYGKISNHIQELKYQLFSFVRANQVSLRALQEAKRKDDAFWLVKHFDYLRKHQNILQNCSPFKEIVIDCFDLYKTAGLAGVAFSGCKKYIYLKDLFNIWDNGFTYNGYPIISIERYIHHGERKYITYIKDNTSIRESVANIDIKPLVKMVSRCTIEMSEWEYYKTIDIIRYKGQKNNLDQD